MIDAIISGPALFRNNLAQGSFMRILNQVVPGCSFFDLRSGEEKTMGMCGKLRDSGSEGFSTLGLLLALFQKETRQAEARPT
jgi:hypothetical protein